jgi:hypothetical protein
MAIETGRGRYIHTLPALPQSPSVLAPRNIEAAMGVSTLEKMKNRAMLPYTV